MIFIFTTLLAAAAAAEPDTPAASAPWALSVGGYGELTFALHDHGPDRTGEGGAPADARLVFDQTRFVAAIEGEAPGDLEFEAEVEFEHGGTGSAMELEYEEFGEYEQEVEVGGEVTLEELYVENGFGEHVSLKLGRFYVAFGQLYDAHQPTDYLGAGRPESETTLVPGVWDEMGVALEVESPAVAVVLQAVSGLDSTGFSSQYWVGSGQQGRFEEIRATALAGVGRVDLVAVEGMVVGASAWVGDAAGNRPKDDMEGVSAPLVLVDLHEALDLGPVRSRGTVIWGHLSGADEISEKNSRLSNNLDVLRTPVADQGLAAWVEFGVDLLPDPDHRLEPYVRAEHLDTMLAVSEETFDNPRYARTILAAGCGYARHGAVGKLELSRRSFANPSIRPETTARLTVGFVY